MASSRREFLGEGVALAALCASGGAEGRLVERARDWDPAAFERIAARPATHKLAFDCTSTKGGTFLNNVKNALNGLAFGFGIAPERSHLVAALHGQANLVSFEDAMWREYRLGELFGVSDPATGGPAQKNPFAGPTGDPRDREPDSERGLYQDASVRGLQARGVDFFT